MKRPLVVRSLGLSYDNFSFSNGPVNRTHVFWTFRDDFVFVNRVTDIALGVFNYSHSTSLLCFSINKSDDQS